jgi:hypothetical protein
MDLGCFLGREPRHRGGGEGPGGGGNTLRAKIGGNSLGGVGFY